MGRWRYLIHELVVILVESKLARWSRLLGHEASEEIEVVRAENNNFMKLVPRYGLRCVRAVARPMRLTWLEGTSGIVFVVCGIFIFCKVKPAPCRFDNSMVASPTMMEKYCALGWAKPTSVPDQRILYLLGDALRPFLAQAVPRDERHSPVCNCFHGRDRWFGATQKAIFTSQWSGGSCFSAVRRRTALSWSHIIRVGT